MLDIRDIQQTLRYAGQMKDRFIYVQDLVDLFYGK